MWPRQLKKIGLAAVVTVGVLIVLLAVAKEISPQLFGFGIGRPRTTSYSDLRARVEAGEVAHARIGEGSITATLKGGGSLRAVRPEDSELLPRLLAAGVEVEAARASKLWLVVANIVPVLLLLAALGFILRRQLGGKNGFMGLDAGRARVKVIEPGSLPTRFGDVAGIDEIRFELEELRAFLREPDRFQELGAAIPKGVLLAGEPGVGKTMLARALANEAGVPFFAISGSDFIEMFVGVGAARVRDLFERARDRAPAIVFIDEIDAIGRRRGSGQGNANEEREQALNQILVEMDGFAGNKGVIVLAATNRADILDKALLRPGRFDRQITVPSPDVKGREAILRVVSRGMKLGRDVDLGTLARMTPGFTGAGLKTVLNEAALIAGTLRAATIEQAHIEQALDKTIMGKARGSLTMRDEERRITAYHEAGHALVASLLPHSDPVHKATILPHGQALGAVMRKPEEDRFHASRGRMLAELMVAMAGRAAEEIIFGHGNVTAGASADIAHATRLARRMVVEWGMDEEVGPVQLVEAPGDADRPVLLGEQTRALADGRIKALITESLSSAHGLISAHRPALDRLAKALLERETLDGASVRGLIAEPA